VLSQLLEVSGVRPELPSALAGKVELAVRAGEDADYWFLVNRTDDAIEVGEVEGEPLPGPSLAASGTLGPRQVRVLRRT
jgi:beta-galactosidase